MGDIVQHSPVLLFLAAFSRHGEALRWAQETAEAAFGPIAVRSEPFPFDQTDYYRDTMGDGLQKVLWAFERPIDPGTLPEIKHRTRGWEEAYRVGSDHPEERPLNLDPGYVTEAKLVLATTKDRDHRVYLSRGIFGEVTLHYQGGAWQPRPWTYRDYRLPGTAEFLDRCRARIRGKAGA